MEQTGYAIMNELDGQKVVISEETLTEHILVVGADGFGKTSFLINLLQIHYSMGRSFAVFDSDGKLWNHSIAMLTQKDDQEIVPLDTTENEYITGFNPLKKQEWLSSAKHAERLTGVTLEAGWREGLDMASHESNPISGLRAMLGLVTQPKTFFYYSLGQNVNVIDFAKILQVQRKFLAKIPREKGSYIYGMMLFDAFMIAAERVKIPDLYLVLVDDMFGFFGKTSAIALPHLSGNRIAIVISATYDQLAWAKKHSPELYLRLLNQDQIGSIAAFGARKDYPNDVVKDIATRFVKKPPLFS